MDTPFHFSYCFDDSEQLLLFLFLPSYPFFVFSSRTNFASRMYCHDLPTYLFTCIWSRVRFLFIVHTHG